MALTVTAAGNTQNAASGSSKAQTFSVSGSIGDTIVLRFGWRENAGGSAVSTIVDTKSNSWTIDLQGADASSLAGMCIARSVLTSAVTGGSDSVTVTTNVATDAQCIALVKVDAGTLITPIVTDGSNQALSSTGLVTTLAPGSTTPTQNPDWAVYSLTKIAVASGTTPPAGWTETSDAAAGALMTMECAHLTAVTASNAALNPAPTWTGGAKCRIGMVIYECQSAVVPTLNELALLGVG